MIIRIKITKEKLDQELFFKGTKGTYIDLTLLENKNGTDEYGNDFICVQDIGKERRAAGEKGPIVGNAKIVSRNAPVTQDVAPAPNTQSTSADEDPAGW